MLFQSLNHCEMELMLKSIKSASSFRIPAYDVEKIKKNHTKFDASTIFYDVFITSCNGNHSLIAVGPPLSHHSHKAGVKIKINDSLTKPNIFDDFEKRISIYTCRIEKILDKNSVDIIFNSQVFHVDVDVLDISSQAGKRCLVAIQKNNNVRWIKDWIHHYKNNYGIDEVYIYDNGSQNVDELELSLDGLAKVIRWDFLFGPAESPRNCFAQVGALNHCMLKYSNDAVVFNFDIDELLISSRDFIDAKLTDSPVIYIDSYNVPRTGNLTLDYSFYDFTYRYKNIRGSARKHIFHSNKVKVVSHHNTWSDSGFLFFKKTRRNTIKPLDIDKAYFLHFLGVTTNWKSESKRDEIVSKDELVFDDSHVKMKVR